MENICELCGEEPSSKNPVASLTELGGRNEAAHEEVRLCKTCVKRREVRSWDRRGIKARAIHEALDERPAPHGRFAYLEDVRRIHLVRMRHGWISAHAAVTTS